MNEMDLLATFRYEVPRGRVSPRAEKLFVTGLREQAARPGQAHAARMGPGQDPRRKRPWRLAMAAGLSAALAAGIAGLVLSSIGPATTGGSLTAKLLADRSAATALAAPSVRPGQWIYWKATGLNAGQSQSTRELWATASYSAEAEFTHGRLVIHRPPLYRPRVSYRSLGKLPRHPRALIARLGGGGRAFEAIGSLLGSYVMPPRLTAELYQALGDFADVKIDKHAVDVTGRSGVGFFLTDRRGGNQEIIMNPRTYRFMGYEFLASGRSVRSESADSGAWGDAILREAPVSGPGVRPRTAGGPVNN